MATEDNTKLDSAEIGRMRLLSEEVEFKIKRAAAIVELIARVGDDNEEDVEMIQQAAWQVVYLLDEAKAQARQIHIGETA